MSESSSNSKIISNSIVYTVTGLLQKCFSFFLLPLYTNYLTADDYGITSVVNSFISVMSFVVAFSLYSAVLRFYVDLKNNKEKLSIFYGTVSLFVLFSGVMMGLFLTVFRGPLMRYVFKGIDFYPVIIICLISLIFNCQHTIYTNVIRSQQKAMKYAVLNITFFLLSVGMNIAFVVFGGMGATGVLLATLIVDALYTVIFYADTISHREMKLCIDFAVLKEALKYSIPIMPHNLSTHIATLVSKMLISGTGVGSLASLGLYSVATQFGNFSDIVQNYVEQAYGPWLFEQLKEKNTAFKQSIRSVVKMLCAVIGLFFLGIALFSHDYIVLLVNKSYVEAWKMVPLIVLTYAIKTSYYFYINVLLYYKSAAKKVFIATLTGSIVNIFTSAAIIPVWGAYGSILADAIAMVVRVGIIIYISKKCEDVGLHVMDFVWNFLIVSAFIILGLLPSYFIFPTRFSIFNFGYKVVVVLIYTAMIFFAHKTELLRYIDMLRKKFLKK